MEEKNGFLSKSWLFFINHKAIVIIVLFILLGGGYYWYDKNFSNDNAIVTYKTKVAEKGELVVSVTGSGQINPQSQVNLKPVVAGDAIEVIDVYVKNDQEVKKDQVIAVLNFEDAQKSVRNAEIELRSAQIKLKQIQNQYKTETIEDKWNRQLQEISVQQKNHLLNDAKEKLEDYYIKAPFDGVVTDLAVEAGDSISQSDVLASVITSKMVANITLNEVDAAMVKNGNEVTLTLDALSDEIINGKVSKVDTIGNVESGVVSYGLEIEFESENNNLKPGMSVDAEIKIENKKDVIIVPNSAIKNGNKEKYVLVYVGDGNISDDGKKQSIIDQLQIQKKMVEVGISNDTSIEIKSGIKEGDVIIISSSDNSSTINKETSSSSGSGILPTMSGPGTGSGPNH